MSSDEDRDGIGRQLEQGGLHAHTILSRHAERINRLEALLQGLIELGLDSGYLTSDQVATYSRRVRERMERDGQSVHAGVVLRLPRAPEPTVEVDCTERLPLCQAVCCRLAFALSASEIEAGAVRWELGQPYYARKDAAGMCVHCGAGGCTVYADRPGVCRGYSCAGDRRIWIDFERRIINREWIDAHVAAGRPRMVFMDPDSRPEPGPGTR